MDMFVIGPQPNLETLVQIAKCLNVKVVDLIKEPQDCDKNR